MDRDRMDCGATRLMLGLALAASLAGAGSASERDERPGHPDEEYSLSAAHQSGRFAAWRLDRFDGRVSVCLREGADELVCSLWSAAATPTVLGPFAINAENSPPIGTLWVWRIDTHTGRLDYCSISCCGNLVTSPPICITSKQ
jgi:hypothetical protein